MSRSAALLKSVVVIALLCASALAVLLAPLQLPDTYSWTRHTVSEAAGQGVEGAWPARAGLALFGFAALAQSAWSRPRWGGAGTLLLGAFGALMIAAAVFSARPWEPDLSYDRTEDVLHSVAATAMGFAFAFGVLSVALRRTRSDWPHRAMDVVAVVASVVIPLSMTVWEDRAGVLQRAMFAIAYAWFAVEAIALARAVQPVRDASPS
jgi:hypothetical protein